MGTEFYTAYETDTANAIAKLKAEIGADWLPTPELEKQAFQLFAQYSGEVRQFLTGLNLNAETIGEVMADYCRALFGIYSTSLEIEQLGQLHEALNGLAAFVKGSQMAQNSFLFVASNYGTIWKEVNDYCDIIEAENNYLLLADYIKTGKTDDELQLKHGPGDIYLYRKGLFNEANIFSKVAKPADLFKFFDYITDADKVLNYTCYLLLCKMALKASDTELKQVKAPKTRHITCVFSPDVIGYTNARKQQFENTLQQLKKTYADYVEADEKLKKLNELRDTCEQYAEGEKKLKQKESERDELLKKIKQSKEGESSQNEPFSLGIFDFATGGHAKVYKNNYKPANIETGLQGLVTIAETGDNAPSETEFITGVLSVGLMMANPQIRPVKETDDFITYEFTETGFAAATSSNKPNAKQIEAAAKFLNHFVGNWFFMFEDADKKGKIHVKFEQPFIVSYDLTAHSGTIQINKRFSRKSLVLPHNILIKAIQATKGKVQRRILCEVLQKTHKDADDFRNEVFGTSAEIEKARRQAIKAAKEANPEIGADELEDIGKKEAYAVKRTADKHKKRDIGIIEDTLKTLKEINVIDYWGKTKSGTAYEWHKTEYKHPVVLAETDLKKAIDAAEDGAKLPG